MHFSESAINLVEVDSKADFLYQYLVQLKGQKVKVIVPYTYGMHWNS